MNLKEKYKKEVVPQMKKSFGYKNALAVPGLSKAVVNVGFGKKVAGQTSQTREKVVKNITDNLSRITGQKPVLTRARHSVSGFGLRQGAVIGAKATLRGQRMLDFFDKLVKLVLPRTRDFRGLDPKSVDDNGNLTVGLEDYTAFPESLPPEKQEDIFGLEVCFTTTAKDREQGLALLKLMGIPFKTTPKSYGS